MREKQHKIKKNQKIKLHKKANKRKTSNIQSRVIYEGSSEHERLDLML